MSQEHGSKPAEAGAVKNPPEARGRSPETQGGSGVGKLFEEFQKLKKTIASADSATSSVESADALMPETDVVEPAPAANAEPATVAAAEPVAADAAPKLEPVSVEPAQAAAEPVADDAAPKTESAVLPEQEDDFEEYEDAQPGQSIFLDERDGQQYVAIDGINIVIPAKAWNKVVQKVIDRKNGTVTLFLKYESGPIIEVDVNQALYDEIDKELTEDRIASQAELDRIAEAKKPGVYWEEIKDKTHAEICAIKIINSNTRGAYQLQMDLQRNNEEGRNFLLMKLFRRGQEPSDGIEYQLEVNELQYAIDHLEEVDPGEQLARPENRAKYSLLYRMDAFGADNPKVGKIYRFFISELQLNRIKYELGKVPSNGPKSIDDQQGGVGDGGVPYYEDYSKMDEPLKVIGEFAAKGWKNVSKGWEDFSKRFVRRKKTPVTPNASPEAATTDPATAAETEEAAIPTSGPEVVELKNPKGEPIKEAEYVLLKTVERDKEDRELTYKKLISFLKKNGISYTSTREEKQGEKVQLFTGEQVAGAFNSDAELVREVQKEIVEKYRKLNLGVVTYEELSENLARIFSRKLNVLSTVNIDDLIQGATIAFEQYFTQEAGYIDYTGLIDIEPEERLESIATALTESKQVRDALGLVKNDTRIPEIMEIVKNVDFDSDTKSRIVISQPERIRIALQIKYGFSDRQIYDFLETVSELRYGSIKPDPVEESGSDDDDSGPDDELEEESEADSNQPEQETDPQNSENQESLDQEVLNTISERASEMLRTSISADVSEENRNKALGSFQTALQAKIMSNGAPKGKKAIVEKAREVEKAIVGDNVDWMPVNDEVADDEDAKAVRNYQIRIKYSTVIVKSAIKAGVSTANRTP